jgi:hypothetical protein
LTIPPKSGARIPFKQPATGHAKVRVVANGDVVATSPQLTKFAKEHEFMVSLPAGTEWKLEVFNTGETAVECFWVATEMRLVDL